MRINVCEAYRENFEVFISEYQKLCDKIVNLVVENAPTDELNTYCRHNHPDVIMKLTDTVSSSDVMKGIANKCSVTYITPLEDIIEHYNITGGIVMIQKYQQSLDKYLSKLRFTYLSGSSKDIFNAETIIFILDWAPDEASFLSIRHLLYKAFIDLNKRIIFQDTGEKICIYLLCNNCTIYQRHTCTPL